MKVSNGQSFHLTSGMFPNPHHILDITVTTLLVLCISVYHLRLPCKSSHIGIVCCFTPRTATANIRHVLVPHLAASMASHHCLVSCQPPVPIKCTPHAEYTAQGAFDANITQAESNVRLTMKCRHPQAMMISIDGAIVHVCLCVFC